VPALGQGAGWKDSQARKCPRLLPLGGERRGEEAARQGAKECPPIHYSIT